jgi:hypothetical protein
LGDRGSQTFDPQGGDVSSRIAPSQSSVHSLPVRERDLNVLIAPNCVIGRYDNAGPPVDTAGRAMSAGVDRDDVRLKLFDKPRYFVRKT